MTVMRTFVSGHMIATYPCNGVFVTELIDGYGRRLETETSFDEGRAKYVHALKANKFKGHKKELTY